MFHGERKILNSHFLGKRIRETVIVKNTENKKINVFPIAAGELQGGCGKCNLCGSKDKNKVLTFSCNNSEELAIGEEIVIERFILNEALAAVLVFGMPLIFAVAVQLFFYVASPQESSSGKAVFLTFGAAFASFFVINIFERILKNKFPMKVVEDA